MMKAVGILVDMVTCALVNHDIRLHFDVPSIGSKCTSAKTICRDDLVYSNAIQSTENSRHINRYSID